MGLPEAKRLRASMGIKQVQAQYLPQVLKLVLIKSIYFIAQILCFWLFSLIMHQFIVDQQGYLVWQLNLFSFSAIVWLVAKHIGQWQALRLNNRIKHDLQNQVNQSLGAQQHALAQQYSTFHWQQVFLKNIPALAGFLSEYATQKYLAALIPVFALVIVFSVNWLVALILCVTLPLVPVFMVLVGFGAANLHRKHLVSLERLGGLFIDRLKALTTITTFNQHDNQAALLDSASRLVNKQTMRVVGIAFLSTTVLDFFATISIALVAVYIGLTLLGELNVGPVLQLQYGLFLLLLAPLLFSELKQLGRLYHQKAEAEAAWDSLNPIINLPENLLATSSLGQEFCGIDWLNFHTQTPEIHAHSLHLIKGQKINLQGNSGAGKSVFLRALMGLQPASHHLHGRCILLGQSPVILPSSVRENLSLGYKVTEQALWQALTQVKLADVIRALPQSLETQLGEHPPLSGGELQRLMIARVLLQSADVILLDEPTAHLPKAQHRELALLIHQLMADKTVIWASHKALPKAWFDQVWRINNQEITMFHQYDQGVKGALNV